MSPAPKKQHKCCTTNAKKHLLRYLQGFLKTFWAKLQNPLELVFLRNTQHETLKPRYSSMTLVLGIDPGTATTGYGFVRQRNDDSLETIAYGVILTPAKMPAHERLISIYDQLNELLLLHQPERCAVEKLFFQKNVTNAIAVGQARGVVMLALAQAGMEPAEYTPNEIKLAVSGYGAAGKRQVQEMVRMLLELEKIPRPDDAADALAVAITHIHTKRYE